MAQDVQANTQTLVRVGQFVDVGDCFTPETGITLGAADEAELLTGGAGAATVDISGNTWAAVTSCDGWYNLTLTAGNLATEGMATIVVQDDSVCLPVHIHLNVMAQAAYISKYTAKDTGYMDVDVKAVSGTTQAADDIESIVTGSGHTDDVDISVRCLKIESDTDVALEITSSDDSAIKATCSGNNKHGMELVSTTAGGNGLNALGNGTGDGFHLVAGATGHGISSQGGATSGQGIYATAQDGNGCGILARADQTAGGTGAGICGQGSPAGHGLEATGGTTSGAGIYANAQANNDAGMELVKHGTGKDIDADEIDTIDTVADAIKAVTDLLPNAGALSDLGTILGDTNELQTDWKDGGRLDLLVDAITVYVDLIDDATNGLAAIKAEVEGLAGAAMVGTDNAATEAKQDIMDTAVDAIQTDLDNATDGLGALKDLIDALDAVLTTMKQQVAGTFNRETDSLEAIRDRGDAAWTTGAGGTAPTVEEIEAELATEHGSGSWEGETAIEFEED